MCVSSSRRSARVDFPWSMCATMQKFRMRAVSVTAPLSYEPWLVDSLAVANIKSQIKRNRQNERRRERNKAVRSELKTDAKKVRAAAGTGDAESTAALLRGAPRSIDKAASAGALHKRTAARRKSRLARLATSVEPAAE